MENCQGDLKRTKRLARQLLEFCQTTGLALPDELKDACSELEQRCAETSFQVVVVGMFSRGKSTFLNALIGRRLLYESDREATGSITFLRNSALSSVEIRSPGGTERFPLDEHSYDKIRERVDRNNKESSATQVFVDCPLEHFDEDVLFVDTPGLNGLGEEQAKVTRQAMDHADAVIFLVLPKSLEETELALLRGENPYIGKLRTRNIFFAMTKIGPMLDGVPPEREELRRRSRFDPFRQALAQRLERGNRARQTQSDMWELMLDICEMPRETLEAQLARRKQAGVERRKELEDKRDQYEHTKRRSFLRISKYIREQIDTLNDGVEKDSAQRQAAVQKKADGCIYHSFNREDDFCTGEYRKLTEQLRRWTSEASNGMAGNVNKVYQSLSAQLSQFTEQTIRETFGLPSSADYFMETISIQRGQVQDVSLMDAEKELERKARITFRDPARAPEVIPMEQAKNYSAKLRGMEDAAGDDRVEDEVSEVRIYLSSPLLENGVEIIDTPGLNSACKKHTEITRRIMDQSDATIFLFDYEQAGKATEFEAIEFLSACIRKAFLVVNKIDVTFRAGILRRGRGLPPRLPVRLSGGRNHNRCNGRVQQR